MDLNVLLAELERNEELEDLRTFLQTRSDKAALREGLFSLLRAVVEYETAKQWAQAVRICEALAITGWGSLERVDAFSRFNGDCWETWFINAHGEYRFRLGRWKRRKKGWILLNPEYHFSKDLPEIPSKSWKVFAGVEFPAVDLAALASQRNYQPQMPIVMGTIGGLPQLSDRVFELKRELTCLLHDNMRPNEYGDTLENLFLTLHCEGGAAVTAPRLKIGAYRPQKRAFYCDLHFNPGYARLNREQQVEVFRSALDQAVDSLEAKMSKTHIEYDFAAFRADLRRTFAIWRQGQD